MTIRLNGQTSGYVELEAPATAGSNTLVLPANNGTSGQYLQTNGSGTLSWAEPAGTGATWVTGTLTSLSGGDVTITGIPSNAVQVLITIQQSSTAGSSSQFLRLGAGGTPLTSGYSGASGSVYSSLAATSNTTGSFNITTLTSSSHSFSGHILITNIDTGDYVVTSQMHSTFNEGNNIFGGRIALGGTLDRVQWGSGSTFDSGQIRVDYLTQD
jgi:hypothetical protein